MQQNSFFHHHVPSLTTVALERFGHLVVGKYTWHQKRVIYPRTAIKRSSSVGGNFSDNVISFDPEYPNEDILTKGFFKYDIIITLDRR